MNNGSLSQAGRPTNHLAGSQSPYLQAHAHDPVAWLPWGTEAFARAAARDLPLLISIGFSSCHWCHVMAAESFLDETIADQINASFVPIKVDREERPDVDAIYLEAVQRLSGRGGWPLTVFATPDGDPFHGGTYYPRHPGKGARSFPEILDLVATVWRDRRDDVLDRARATTAAIAVRLAPSQDELAARVPEPLERALEEYAAAYDAEHAGIGVGAKFPQPAAHELLLHAHALGYPAALEPVLHLLRRIADSAVHDHVGGGFARYASDREWREPHFEKMLYDQAQLARLYLHAWQVTGDGQMHAVMESTLRYVLRDLASPDGGIAAAEDADVDGHEGAYYTWTVAELADALGDDGPAAAEYFGVTADGTFPGGRSVLVVDRTAAPPSEQLEGWRRRLSIVRSRRTRPRRDDKVITEWNAMTVATLAEAGAATGTREWLQAAERIGTFLLRRLRRDDGRWLRYWSSGESHHLATAADYAWLVECFVRLYEATGKPEWINEAIDVAERLDDLFAADGGGWYMNGNDVQDLIVRVPDWYDNVTPSATAVATNALLRLGAVTGLDGFTARANSAIAAAGRALSETPLALPLLTAAAATASHGGMIEVVIAGGRPDLVATARSRFAPDLALAWGARSDLPIWHAREEGMAYVCRDGTCHAPVSDPAALDSLLTSLS